MRKYIAILVLFVCTMALLAFATAKKKTDVIVVDPLPVVDGIHAIVTVYADDGTKFYHIVCRDDAATEILSKVKKDTAWQLDSNSDCGTLPDKFKEKHVFAGRVNCKKAK